MPAQKRVKAGNNSVQLVGVIMTPADLKMALRLPTPPDLFEVRLDALSSDSNLARKIRELRVPLIITARHPAEGGLNRMPTRNRRDLLLSFLGLARYVDIELRSVRAHREVIEQAGRLGVSTIISFHDLANTPSLGSLRAKTARAARLRPALFKVATRADNDAQLKRLIAFITDRPSRLPMAVMGIGKLGAVSRLLLTQLGSRFIYTSLKEARVEGQLPFSEVRRWVGELKTRS
jgi:3-dehydroquinate dehydratase-1